MMATVRKQVRIRFSGRVQGVGFRATVAHLAGCLGLVGYVQNEWDGTVSVVAEGTVEDLEEWLRRIYRSRLGRYIEGDARHWSEANGAFNRFTIRYAME